MQRWWCKKFNRPRKDPLLLSYTYEELMVEYFEDLIEADPNEAFSPAALEEGRVVRTSGDPVADRWQREIAEGKAPEIVVDVPEADRERLKRWLAKGKPVEEPSLPEEISVEEFADDYTKEP